MNEIPSISLVDTLNLIQLARETALAKGAIEQAERFTPVVNEINNLVAQSRNAPDTGASQGILGQDGFKQLLNAAQMKTSSVAAQSTQTVLDRNQMIVSMAAANMSDLEIARQMEMTREEVSLVLSMNERAQNGKEIYQ